MSEKFQGFVLRSTFLGISHDFLGNFLRDAFHSCDTASSATQATFKSVPRRREPATLLASDASAAFSLPDIRAPGAHLPGHGLVAARNVVLYRRVAPTLVFFVEGGLLWLVVAFSSAFVFVCLSEDLSIVLVMGEGRVLYFLFGDFLYVPINRFCYTWARRDPCAENPK